MLRVVLDALMLRSQLRIDRVAAGRGLHITLDGVHLNSAGAQLVADAFMQALDDTLPGNLQQRMLSLRYEYSGDAPDGRLGRTWPVSWSAWEDSHRHPSPFAMGEGWR